MQTSDRERKTHKEWVFLPMEQKKRVPFRTGNPARSQMDEVFT